VRARTRPPICRPDTPRDGVCGPFALVIEAAVGDGPAMRSPSNATVALFPGHGDLQGVEARAATQIGAVSA